MERTVVITGATTSFAPHVARAFASDGAHVVIGGRNRAVVVDLADAIEADGGTATPERADARDEFDVERLMESASRAGDGIDVVVPAAVVVHDTLGTTGLQATSYSAYDDSMRTNARGVYTAVKEAVPHLEDGARVVVPVSVPGEDAELGTFGASQVARIGIVERYAADLPIPVGAVDVGAPTADEEALDAAADLVRWASTVDDERLDGAVVGPDDRD